jgi:NitT/TauT family transport system permease protein
MTDSIKPGGKAPAAAPPRAPRPARRPRPDGPAFRKLITSELTILGSLATLLFVWWIAALVIDNPLLLAAPPEVAAAFVRSLADGSLWLHIGASMQRVVVGFALATVVAIPLGFALGWFTWSRRLIEPWLQFFRVIPPIAIIPLVILWLGIGEEGKVFLIFWAAFLQIIVAVIGGVIAIDATTIRAARVLGAKSLDIFLDIAVPASMSYIFVGLRQGLAASWATLVAAELIAASRGLGYLIVQAGNYRDVPVILLGIIVIGILGLLMDRLILLVERRMTRWQEREER